jgi:alcohol dehydrogenase class IV
MPRLSMYGVREQDFATIIKEADNKNNPVNLNDDEMIGLLRERL